jgi:hypothetical protein
METKECSGLISMHHLSPLVLRKGFNLLDNFSGDRNDQNTLSSYSPRIDFLLPLTSQPSRIVSTLMKEAQRTLYFLIADCTPSSRQRGEIS